MNNLDVPKLTKPPQYIIQPPTLKELASQQIAVMNYRYQIKYHCKKYIVRMDWFDCSDFKIKDKLGADANFLENIFESKVMWPVGHSINVWIERNVQNVYFDLKCKKDILHCLEHLVLKPDGSVSYLDTSKKLMICNKLSTVEKYRFACANCLVDDIEKFWPLVSNNPRISKCINCRERPLITYWNCLMRGICQQLSGRRREVKVILERSEWPANEYIFDLLTEKEQIEAAIFLIYFKTDIFIARIFLKLNQNEKLMREVMKRINPRVVMKHLACTIFLIDDVWNFMVHFIAEDAFVDIIKFFVYDNETFTWDFSYSFLSKIWTNAPENLKQFVLCNVEAVEDIFRKLNFEFYEESTNFLTEGDYYTDMSFFSALLADLHFELRNSLWCKYWRNLIVCSSPDFLNKLMELCFNNKDEIIRFKEDEMMNFNNIEDFCFGLISSGYTKELSEFLNFCSTNVGRIFVLKWEILASPRIRSYFLERQIDQKKFIAFDQFIDSAFIYENDAKEYKKKLIMASVELQKVWAKIDNKMLGVQWM